MAANESPTGTSEIPKKAHLKPDIRYTAGLNKVIVCQIGGSIFIE
jgi:hypothetical protein